MLDSTKIMNPESSAFISFIAFKLLSRKDVLYKQKENNKNLSFVVTLITKQ